MNHYRVFGRVVPCGAKSGTANAGKAITCSACRARLQVKVDSSNAEAARFPEKSQERQFFSGTAAHFAALLDMPEMSL